MPLFHAAGMYMTMIVAVYWDRGLSLGIQDRPLNTDLVVDCLEYSHCDAAFLPPAILEEMSQSAGTIEPLQKLAYIGFAGGNSLKYSKGFLGPSLISPFGIVAKKIML